MIEKAFWEDVRSAWVTKALPPKRERAISSGSSGKGIMNSDFSEDEWGMDDGIPFDMVDYDQAITAGLFGENFDIKSDDDLCPTQPETQAYQAYHTYHAQGQGQAGGKSGASLESNSKLNLESNLESNSEINSEINSGILKPNSEISANPEMKVEPELRVKQDAVLNSEEVSNPASVVNPEIMASPKPVKRKRPKLNTDQFEWLIEQQTIPAYTEACHLLLECELPESMDELMNQLIERMSVLQETAEKFGGIYEADLSQFYEYYIPEALELTSTYLEYLDLDIGEELINETEREVMDAIEKLVLGVNEKIEEICKYAMIEIRAKAKALDSMMSQDGYVGSEFKIR